MERVSVCVWKFQLYKLSKKRIGYPVSFSQVCQRVTFTPHTFMSLGKVPQGKALAIFVLKREQKRKRERASEFFSRNHAILTNFLDKAEQTWSHSLFSVFRSLVSYHFSIIVMRMTEDKLWQYMKKKSLNNRNGVKKMLNSPPKFGRNRLSYFFSCRRSSRRVVTSFDNCLL